MRPQASPERWQIARQSNPAPTRFCATTAYSPPLPRAWLKERALAPPEALAAGAGVDLASVPASLSLAAGQGQVVYDLLGGVYRYRPLIEGDLPPGVGLETQKP